MLYDRRGNLMPHGPKRFRWMALGIVSMALSAGIGCTLRQHDKAMIERKPSAGEQSSKTEQSYDQKVAELREKVAEDPHDDRNQIRLAEAESKAADAHIQRARQFRADRQPREAVKELTIALEQVPVHPEAITMRDELLQQIAQSEKLAWDATAAAEQSQWDRAAELADEALAIDRMLTAARHVRDEARAAALDLHLTEARKALGENRPEDGLAAVEKLKKIDPNHAEALTLEKDLLARQQQNKLQAIQKQRDAVSSQPASQTLIPPSSAASTQPAPTLIATRPADFSPPAQNQTPKPVAETPPAPPQRSRVTRRPPPVEKQLRVAETKRVTIFKGALSRDDDRYEKQRRITRAISIKIRDTDEDPLDADIEIRIGTNKRDYDDLKVGSTIQLRTGGRTYRFTLLKIEDRNETIWFTLDREER